MDIRKNMTKQISLAARALAVSVVVVLVLAGTAMGFTSISETVTQQSENPSLNLIWNYKFGGVHGLQVSMSSNGDSTVAGSYVELASLEGYLSFFDRNGNQLWKNYPENLPEGGHYAMGGAAISPDGNYVAGGSGDNKVYFFDKNGNLLWKYNTGGNPYMGEGDVGKVSVSSNGNYIVAINYLSADSNVILLLNKKGELLWKSQENTLITTSISNEGDFIAGGSKDGNVYLFDINGKVLWKYKTDGLVYDISISSDGKYIAASSQDSNIYLLNNNGNLLWKQKTRNIVTSVSINDNYVVGGSTGGYLYILDNQGKLILEYKIDSAKTGKSVGVAISQDSRYIAVTFNGEIFYFSTSLSPAVSTASALTIPSVSRAGLVAEYHFDGDAKDSSGNGNDGTIYGATFVDGKFGKALKFNGINNYVSVLDAVSLRPQSITVEGLFYFFAKPPYGKITGMVKRTLPGENDANWQLQFEDIGINFAFCCNPYKGNLYFDSEFAPYQSNEWEHVIVTFDGSTKTAKIYVNGELRITSSSPFGLDTSFTSPVFIGRGYADGYMNGLIDEVRIYNRALSAEEIKANYDSTLGKSPATTATKPAPAPTSSPATPAPTIAHTTIPTPAPTAAPESSNSYVYAGAGIVILLLAIVILRRRGASQVMEPVKPETKMRPEPEKAVLKIKPPEVRPKPEPVPEIKPPAVLKAMEMPVEEPVSEALGEAVNVKTAFGYKGATIIYKVKIENNTAKPISDIKIYPYVPNVFLLKEKEKAITLIEPKSSQTVTFEIRPTGECGDCNVSGRVNYYDMASMERQDIKLESKSLSIVCPMLRRKEISEDAWREMVSGLVKAEETTTDVPIDGEGLFGMISEILKDLNLFMLPPGINRAKQIFRGTARFYGEGVKGLRYAAQIEIVGGARKSKLILKAWAEKEDALTGFYHGVLDEIEKRVKVKEYIDDSIVQYNVHIGDKIGTQVKDSVVQRSNIGAGLRKCSNCGREVEANEKFCLECGAKL